MPESDIYSDTEEYLKSLGWSVRRGASGGRMYKGMKVKAKGKGYPDFEVLVPPNARYFGLEAKDGAKLSDDQIEWICEVERVGGRVFIFDSLERLRYICQKIIKPMIAT